VTPRRASLCGLALLLVAALGCEDTDHSADAAAEAAPALELGQGELSFAPLSEDDALPYVAGSQGGYHVFVSFRVHGMDPTRVLVKVTTSVEAEPSLTLTREGRVNFKQDTETAQGDSSAESSDVYAGWPAQILMAPCHVGERARIEATLSDLRMLTASASQRIRIAMGAGSTPSNCQPAP
jgi:hypothetical protein